MTAHYIFGYGSLICPKSRAITAPTLAKRVATPVKVRGLERLWAKPIPSCSMSAVGVCFRKGSECNGVLIPVNDSELEQFDYREGGYERVLLNEYDVLPVRESNEKDPQGYFQNVGKDTMLWVYALERPVPVTVECPVAQSYLDIILRGCLSISDEFAADFMTKTRGWHPTDFVSEKKRSGQADVLETKEVGYWVNDRESPRYPRADSDYSTQNGTKLDALLRNHRPELAYRHHHSM